MKAANFAPLLAVKLEWDNLVFPVFVSQKLDGIRAIVRNGKLVSRTLKPIPNKFIRSKLELDIFEGLDGELIVGSAWGEGVFQRSSSGVMSKEGEPAFHFYVFDDFRTPEQPYMYRYQQLIMRSRQWLGHEIVVVPQNKVRNRLHLETWHAWMVKEGAEGTIARSTNAPYKYGRSTAKEGILLKLVNYETDEATILDFKEMLHNDNAVEVDNLGHTKRSTKKAGKRAAAMLGAFVCESERYTETFEVGTGFTPAQRLAFWKTKKALKGKIIRYKHKPFGQVDKPRHPVFQGFRNKIDI